MVTLGVGKTQYPFDGEYEDFRFHGTCVFTENTLSEVTSNINMIYNDTDEQGRGYVSEICVGSFTYSSQGEDAEDGRFNFSVNCNIEYKTSIYDVALSIVNDIKAAR